MVRADSLYWADIASGVCTWEWPGQGSPPSTEAIKEAQPGPLSQMADVRPTRKARKKDREQDRHRWESRMGGEQYGGQVYGWR